MSKFTKGPWKVCGKGDCPCNTVGSDHHPIATVESGEWGDSYPAIRLIGTSLEHKYEAYIERMNYGRIDKEEAKANLHLIAAAPALYEALQAMILTWERQEFSIVGSVEKAIAAIAKADGSEGTG